MRIFRLRIKLIFKFTLSFEPDLKVSERSHGKISIIYSYQDTYNIISYD